MSTNDARIEQLLALFKSHGFEVVEGDFVRKDGTHSDYSVRPVDPYPLVKSALRALEDQRGSGGDGGLSSHRRGSPRI